MVAAGNFNQTVALEVKDLHKRFGSLEVLRGVSLAAPEGDVISIIGASGSGKSTLLRCINFLEVPDAGEINLQGELIRTQKRRDGSIVPADRSQVDRARTQLGMVFQSFKRNVITTTAINETRVDELRLKHHGDMIICLTYNG